MQKKPLWTYVLSVIVVLAVINLITWYSSGMYPRTLGTFSMGYLVGMVAMYIATHLYSQKAWPIEE